MRDSNGDEWHTIADAAKAVRRSRRTIERWLDAGLPHQRVRGTRYIRDADLFARLRLILLTEPEVKTRRERPAKSSPPMLTCFGTEPHAEHTWWFYYNDPATEHTCLGVGPQTRRNE